MKSKQDAPCAVTDQADAVVVSHPIGNPNVYNCALSFHEVGKLLGLQTSLYGPLGSSKRRLAGLPRNLVTTHPVYECARLIAQKTPLVRRCLDQDRLVDWVYVSFDRHVSRRIGQEARAVYCYEDSALDTFTRARDLGLARIYELPIMYHREMLRLFGAEVEREPQVAPFVRSVREPEWKRERKDRELEEADLIVVPTEIVRSSITRYLAPKAPIVVNPYGADIAATQKVWKKDDQDGPLRLLFIGKLGPRKGVHVLFEALAGLPSSRFHLTLVGLAEPGFLEWLSGRYKVAYEWLGGLPRPAVYAACRNAHALVLPSLAEGFPLVILEAMASGIPVIASDQTGAANVVSEGTEGWVVPASDAEALRDRFDAMHGIRSLLPEMGAAARRKAESCSWANYRTRLRDLVLPALASCR